MKARIALLFGGADAEHEVSLMGYGYVKQLLGKTDYEILPVYIDRSGDWHLGGVGGDIAYLSGNLGGSLYAGGDFIRIDAAIPLLHGEGGEDGALQGALTLAGVGYVGADSVTSAVCIDKSYTKSIVSALGVPTLDEVAFSESTDVGAALEECKRKLGFPMFIKPRRLGSSVGAYPVYTEDGFNQCFPLAQELGRGLVTVEKMLTCKRELECAFCRLGKEKIITPPGEILIDGFYGYGEKYGGRTRVSPVADLDGSVRDKITDYASRIADRLSLRHLARIDFFLTEDGPVFNEVNTFPGFTEDSLYPKMLTAYGIDPGDALVSFIEDALL